MNYFVKTPTSTGMDKDYYKRYNTGLLNCLSNVLVEGKLLAEDRVLFLDNLNDPVEKSFAERAVAEMLKAPSQEKRVRQNLAYFGAMLKDSEKVLTKGSPFMGDLWHKGEMLNWPEIIKKLSNPAYNIRNDEELLKAFELKLDDLKKTIHELGDEVTK